MNSKRIRLSTAILAVSFVVLMSSAGEVRAVDRQVAFCESGRCIRGIGFAVRLRPEGITQRSGAILMVDLVNKYVAIDTDFTTRIRTNVDIFYYGFSIRISAPHMGVSGIIGLPGFATAYFIPPNPPGPDWAELRFYGFASFYNKMEPMPV